MMSPGRSMNAFISVSIGDFDGQLINTYTVNTVNTYSMKW